MRKTHRTAAAKAGYAAAAPASFLVALYSAVEPLLPAETAQDLHTHVLGASMAVTSFWSAAKSRMVELLDRDGDGDLDLEDLLAGGFPSSHAEHQRHGG